MRGLALLAVVVLLSLPCALTTQPAVNAPDGLRYFGQRLPGCLKYLGIPFAKAPLKELRWRAPAPLGEQSGSFNASSYAPMCMQPGKGWSTLSGPMSEDCLYLNVFTPEKYEPQSLPVLVFIHGGDYLQGGAADSELNGCSLVRVTGNAVVVTIQYRLGVFGFLGDKRLAAREKHDAAATTSTGNYGLLDQIAALRWIASNIGVFGGSREKIMIFGESAGAGSVTNLLISPLARGLFHRAVMQSGAFALWTTKRMEDAAGVFANLLNTTGCAREESDLKCLEAMAADKLVKAAEKITAYADQWTICRWAPTVDGVALTVHPADIFLLGHASRIDMIADIPVMYGNNDEEGSSFLSETRMSSSAGIDPSSFTLQDFREWIERNFDDAAEIEKAYPVGGDYPTPWFAAQRIVGDFMLFCHSRRAAAAISAASVSGKRTHSVFEYIFDHAPQNTKWGAYHGAEVPYVFGNIPEGDDSDSLEEWELAQSMAWVWTTFGQYGVPVRGINTSYAMRVPPAPVAGLQSIVKPWPAFLEFDTRRGGGVSIKEGLREDVCDTLWNLRSSNGNAIVPSRHDRSTPTTVVIAIICSVAGAAFMIYLGRRYWHGTSMPDANKFLALSETSDRSDIDIDMNAVDLSDLN